MGQFVALALIGGGAYWLITSGALDELLQSLGLAPLRSTVAPTAEQQRYAEQVRAAELAAFQSADAAELSERQRSAAGAYAFAGAGASTAAGIAAAVPGITAGGAMGALALTGYGAAAALLVWGIAQKGWFRGGEEGVQVNPARDQFIKVFVDTYYPGAGSERQFEAMVRALADGANGGVHGEDARAIIAQLYSADTMDEFKVAAERFLRAMKEGR